MLIKSIEENVIEEKSNYADYDWYYNLNSISMEDITPDTYSYDQQLVNLAYQKAEKFFNQIFDTVLAYIQDEKNHDYDTAEFSSIWERLKYDVYHADPPVFEDAIIDRCYKEMKKLNLDSIDKALLWVYGQEYDSGRENGPEEDMECDISRSIFNALYEYADKDNDENGEIW